MSNDRKPSADSHIERCRVCDDGYEYVPYAKVVKNICSTDANYINNQYVDENKLQVYRRGGRDLDDSNVEYVVRRLTPRETERLMGFPDDWTLLDKWTDTKGKVHKGSADANRFKALGNSICTGKNSSWEMLMLGICRELGRKAYLGSLFDGIGGFPYIWNAINGDDATLWASEIEEFPIAVTKKHFPKMKHLGDVTKLNGADLPLVDCIVGGSPCQDLSSANNNRKGLDGERSGLFMEQVRILKEMRESAKRNGRTDVPFPRFLIWENVTGAFSSGKPSGEDFRIVLEELCKVAEPSISIPRPPQGKWQPSGYIVGDGFSIAYRVMSAEFFNVPQRRKRIHLVCDYGGFSAGKILFECESLSGSAESCESQKQEITSNFGSSIEIPNSKVGGGERTTYGCDLETTRDVGIAFYKETSKTIVNGTCPGRHNSIVVKGGVDASDTMGTICSALAKQVGTTQDNCLICEKRF